MLIYQQQKFVRTPFRNEAELEDVVVTNYEYLFGPDSIFLPKTKIRTADGAGTIPDGFAIDLAERKWYIVEAELGHHDVWNHIAKQISKQIVAALQPTTKRQLEDVSVDLYQQDNQVKEKFTAFNIQSVDVRKVVRDILEKDPVLGIPIDHIPADLKDWANQQRLSVKLWIINKFVALHRENEVVYELPEEFRPSLDTALLHNQDTRLAMARYDVAIGDLVYAGLLKEGQAITLVYKPRNADQKVFRASITSEASIEVLEQRFSSPSTAALLCMQAAGSSRQTVNGWTSWKDDQGRTLATLREMFLAANEPGQAIDESFSYPSVG